MLSWWAYYCDRVSGMPDIGGTLVLTLAPGDQETIYGPQHRLDGLLRREAVAWSRNQHSRARKLAGNDRRRWLGLGRRDEANPKRRCACRQEGASLPLGPHAAKLR